MAKSKYEFKVRLSGVWIKCDPDREKTFNLRQFKALAQKWKKFQFVEAQTSQHQWKTLLDIFNSLLQENATSKAPVPGISIELQGLMAVVHAARAYSKLDRFNQITQPRYLCKQKPRKTAK